MKLSDIAETKKTEVIIQYLSQTTDFTKEEIEHGLSQCNQGPFKTDQVFKAVFANGLEDPVSGGLKMAFLNVYLGNDFMQIEGLRETYLTSPKDDDFMVLTALYMFANKEKFRKFFLERQPISRIQREQLEIQRRNFGK